MAAATEALHLYESGPEHAGKRFTDITNHAASTINVHFLYTVVYPTSK